MKRLIFSLQILPTSIHFPLQGGDGESRQSSIRRDYLRPVYKQWGWTKLWLTSNRQRQELWFWILILRFRIRFFIVLWSRNPHPNYIHFNVVLENSICLLCNPGFGNKWSTVSAPAQLFLQLETKKRVALFSWAEKLIMHSLNIHLHWHGEASPSV